MSKHTPQTQPSIPSSCTHPAIGLVGLITFLLTCVFLRKSLSFFSAHSLGLLLASYALPVIALEAIVLKNYRRISTGLDFSRMRPANISRVAIKLTGLGGTLCLAGLAYWLFPEYQNLFYVRYFLFLELIAPYFLILVIPYFYFVDRFMASPEDDYYQAGLFFIGAWKSVNRKLLWQFFLGWTVKAFFLPLMYSYFLQEAVNFQNTNFHQAFLGFQSFYNLCFHGVFFLDVMIVTVGYFLTMKLFDSHIRSAEPTVSGWIVALMCYQPFWGMMSDSFLKYNPDHISWGGWLGSSFWYPVWGVAILVSEGIFLYASVIFGIRFSNLTHRGIISNGPYAWTKHPAYVAKLVSFALISVPWISESGWRGGLRQCLLLALLAVLYYGRAKTEERHLSRDPVYVQYALAMNKKSVFAPLGALWPALQYKPPVSQSS
ncbi:MAG: isoprenylcysteine carboxyl methyltransferase [Candidatus Omnitrophica bacterium]|nr:isoprenylcysteine carboxyl methyltransferase [Candidatus Omnitrophota bacterium]